MAVGQLAEAAQEGGRRGHVATLTLHRLDDEGRRPGRRHDRREEPLEMVERGRAGGLRVTAEVAVGMREGRDVHVRQERVVAGAVVEAGAGDAEGAVGAPVEGAVEGDDVRPTGRPAGQLDGPVHDLRAGVAEVDRVEALGHLLDQHLRQARHRLQVPETVADVEQAVDLRVDGRIDPGVGVAEGRHGDAVGEVEVAAAVGVVEPVALAAHPGPLEVATQDGRERGQGAVTDGRAGVGHGPSIRGARANRLGPGRRG